MGARSHKARGHRDRSGGRAQLGRAPAPQLAGWRGPVALRLREERRPRPSRSAPPRVLSAATIPALRAGQQEAPSLQGFWVQVLSDARTRTFCQSESCCVSPSAPRLRPLLAHGPPLLSTARVDFAGKGTAWKKRRFGREDASSFVIVLCTPHCNGPHDSGINFGMKF